MKKKQMGVQCEIQETVAEKNDLEDIVFEQE